MLEIMLILCAIMSVVCATSLFSGYRRTANRLLLWGGLCFLFLALNNVFMFIDVVLLPHTDLAGPFWRNLLSAIAGCLLLVGLILEIA